MTGYRTARGLQSVTIHMPTRIERSAAPLIALLLVMGATGCDPLGQTELVLDNQTTYDLLVTVDQGSEPTDVRLAQGESQVIAEGSSIPDAPPPERVAVRFEVHASIGEDFIAVYDQDPLDPDAWREVKVTGDCEWSECRRFLLTLHDSQLDLPAISDQEVPSPR